MLATTPRFAASFFVSVAACAGSYCPAVAVTLSRMIVSNLYPAIPPLAFCSSMARSAPSLISSAFSASAPVSEGDPNEERLGLGQVLRQPAKRDQGHGQAETQHQP
jgi:hypothetical protein